MIAGTGRKGTYSELMRIFFPVCSAEEEHGNQQQGVDVGGLESGHVDQRVCGVEACEEEVAVCLQAREREKGMIPHDYTSVRCDGLRDVYEV